MTAPTVLIDGRPATVDDLTGPALVNYGHYTTMQVRDGAARGLDRHWARLRMQHEELFGSDLDLDRVREWMRAAVGQQPDCQLRVNVYEDGGEARVMISSRPAIEAGTEALSLLPVDYARPVAHLKHVGGFGQSYFARQARLRGFDDALLITPTGHVAETSIANIGFLDGTSIVWPDAPVLHGTTWQLLDDVLPRFGLTATRVPVTLETARSYIGAFVANSTGIVPVRRIGDHVFGETSDLVRELDLYYQSTPWDPI